MDRDPHPLPAAEPTVTPALERIDWVPAEDAALAVAKLAFTELIAARAERHPAPPYILAAIAAAAGSPIGLPKLVPTPELPIFPNPVLPPPPPSAAPDDLKNFPRIAADAAARSVLLIAPPNLVPPPILVARPPAPRVIAPPRPALPPPVLVAPLPATVIPAPPPVAAPLPIPLQPAARPARRIAKHLFRLAIRVAAAWLLIVLALTLLYRFVNPPLSNLMLGSLLLGHSVEHTWVALDDISPNLVKAVTMSEDSRFCEHWGVDWASVGSALDEDRSVGFRGASTISMQTAKNMFLWNGRSYLRKAAEFPLSYVLTAVWPKRRLVEIYLNIAEWGPGIYGAEAAARYHFKVGAAKLSSRQSALLAVSLPNPLLRRAGAPTASLRVRALRIEQRMQGAESYLGCVFQ